MDKVLMVASQSPVVMFTTSSCCMCHAVKRLLEEVGAVPAVFELDKEEGGRREMEMEMTLVKLLGRQPAVPALFVGGNLVGGTDMVLTLHLSDRLVPLLREAGALSAN